MGNFTSIFVGAEMAQVLYTRRIGLTSWFRLQINMDKKIFIFKIIVHNVVMGIQTLGESIIKNKNVHNSFV